MASLTESQAELFDRIAATRTGSAVFSEGHGWATVITDDGANIEVLGGDFRELVDLGLLRFVTGSTYELTGRGLEAYQQLTAPEVSKRPVGF
jgi:hypothetical protein